MKTAIKYNALKGMDTQTQLKTLAGAISFEFQKPQLCLEIAGQKGLSNVHGLKGAANEPGFERIKAHLALKYGTASDNPHLVDIANQMEQFYHTNMPELDLGFTLLFDLVDLRNSTHDHFDILDTNAGLSWAQRLPGQPIKIRKAITEAKATVSYIEYADGLGLLDQWLQFNQFWNVDEAVAEFRATAFAKMASAHYGLLTALSSGVNQAFATDDVTTANNAAATILRAVKSKGYGTNQNAGFYAVCAPEHVGRLERMLTAQRGSAMVDAGTVSQPLAYRIQGIISSTDIPANSTGWYLVLPGRKLKRGVWMDLTVESGRSIYTSATDLVGRQQFNAAIGDTDQVRRVLFS
jgi:hypothetical protein